MINIHIICLQKLLFHFVKSINTFALTYGVPDLTLFLDLAPEEAFKRKGGADLNDRIEAIGLEFHNKVYNGYKQMQSLEPNRIISVDCSKEKEQTHKNIINILKDKLKMNRRCQEYEINLILDKGKESISTYSESIFSIKSPQRVFLSSIKILSLETKERSAFKFSF